MSTTKTMMPTANEVTHEDLSANIIPKLAQMPFTKNPISPFPAFIWGNTGIGKSQVIKAAAKSQAKQRLTENGSPRKFVEWNEMSRKDKDKLISDPSQYYIFADIRLSQADPSDLKGIPSLLSDREAADWRPMALFVALGHPEAEGCLFFDEMNLAPPSIQASAYQIIHDRQVGETPLSKKILILAAGNLKSDKAALFDMAGPLRNRFLHFSLCKPSAENWAEWAMTAGIDPRIVAFIRYKPQLLFRFDAKHAEHAFPTPRSWERVANLIKDIPTENVNWISTLAEASVGQGAAGELAAYLKVAKTVKIMDFMAEPKLARELGQTKVAEKWALVSGISSLYLDSIPGKNPQFDKKAKEKNASDTDFVNRAFEVADHLDPEFGILLLRLLKGNEDTQDRFSRSATKAPSLVNFVKKHKKFVLGDFDEFEK